MQETVPAKEFQATKNICNAEDNPRFDLWRQVRALGQGDPLEEGMATHPSILAWRTPWTEEPGGLQSIGLQRVGHDGRDVACARTHTHTHAHTRIHPASFCRPQFLLALFHLHLSFLSEGQPHSLQALALEVNAIHRLFNQLPQFHEVQLL